MAYNVPRPEVGGIIHLEHVNFTVPGQELITLFYISGLGLTRDPYKRVDETNFGVNVGLQQFHLPSGGPTPPFPGLVHLVHPDLQGAVERLRRLEGAGKFDGTPFALTEGGDLLDIVTPFGPRIHVHAASPDLFPKPVGLFQVDLPIRPGTADGIGAYYRELFDTPVEMGQVQGRPAALVRMGANQLVVFHEAEPQGFDFDYRSFHLAFYTTRYERIAARLAQRPASIKGQAGAVMFFSRDIFDLGSGEQLLALENEVRSIYHPDFMRPLVNRWPMVSEPFTDQFQSRRELVSAVGFTPGKPVPVKTA